MRAYRTGIFLMAGLMMLIGLALIVRGALEQKPIALVLGALFAAAGAGRVYLLRRR